MIVKCSKTLVKYRVCGLRRVFQVYAPIEAAAGEPSLTSLSWRSPAKRSSRGLVSKTSRRLLHLPDEKDDEVEAEGEEAGMEEKLEEELADISSLEETSARIQLLKRQFVLTEDDVVRSPGRKAPARVMDEGEDEIVFLE